MLGSVRTLALPAVLGFAMLAGPAMAGTLADIVARGEIVVGSKADYRPYGFRDKDGHIVGIEPDLAADLARRLGVKLRIEPVTSANRIQMLDEGKVDIVIATMSITEERSQAVSFIDPAYYASGIAGLAAPGASIQSEEDLERQDGLRHQRQLCQPRASVGLCPERAGDGRYPTGSRRGAEAGPLRHLGV